MTKDVYNDGMSAEHFFKKYEPCVEGEHACVAGSRLCLICERAVCHAAENDDVFRSLE